MGLKDMLSKMMGKEENQVENSTKTYKAEAGTLETASKKGMTMKAKLALASALAVGVIAISGMAPSDAHAAGKYGSWDNVPQKQSVYKPSAKEIKQIQQQMDKFNKQQAQIQQWQQQDSHSNFLKQLNPDNQMYDQSSRGNGHNIHSDVNMRGANIQGDNIKIGQINDDRGRW